MCGYIGFADDFSAADKKALIKPMMNRINHRGPDMDGVYADEKIALGFKRLSIIDLSENGTQPMFNEDKSVVIVFNGEVYNFVELREELLQKGHVFKSKTDTEVLVHGYEEFGTNLPEKLRGMFSFAIWDINAKTLFAARDHFGIKPFYYSKLSSGGLIFGSEIKSFLDHPNFIKEVNENALRPYLSFQFAAGDATFFKGVFSLSQGHSLLYENGKTTIKPFFAHSYKQDETLSFDEWTREIDDAVHESVEAHSISDVKVGSFLSGGVDSSYITACLMPQNTFSVGFSQNKFNETNYAAELSEKLGIENYKLLLSADECFDAFSDIQYHMDQPQSNPSSVPLWFLAKLAKEHVTVVLSGEGADELFAGYELYANTPAMEKYKKMPLALRRMLGTVAAALPAFKGRNFLMKSAEKPENWFIGQAQVFPEKEALGILKPKYQKGFTPLQMTAPYYEKAKNLPEVTQKQYIDMNFWLPGDILLKADKMCMAHSLELRVPFLDKKIMQLASKIPARHCIQGTENKKVFRAASNKTLPDEWANRPKKGFPVPIRYWLREEKYANIVRGHFLAPCAGEFFNQEALIKLLDNHFSGKANNARKIWTVFTFLVWYKRFFIDEKPKTSKPYTKIR